MNTSLALSSSSVFNFDAEHNGNPCIISTRQEDQGTVVRYNLFARMAKLVKATGSESVGISFP